MGDEGGYENGKKTSEKSVSSAYGISETLHEGEGYSGQSTSHHGTLHLITTVSDHNRYV